MDITPIPNLDTQYSVVLTPYDHPWQSGAKMIEAWRVLNSVSSTNGGTRVTLDGHVEEPNADPLVILLYQKNVLPIIDECQLVLWPNSLWLLERLNWSAWSDWTDK